MDITNIKNESEEENWKCVLLSNRVVYMWYEFFTCGLDYKF
jgi:hypothetical protein